jgi:hypothetical protein
LKKFLQKHSFRRSTPIKKPEFSLSATFPRVQLDVLFVRARFIKASYAGGKGEAAFYEILREKQGRFKFTPGLPPEDFDIPEIGYFMRLLMEGLQRIDERTAPKGH